MLPPARRYSRSEDMRRLSIQWLSRPDGKRLATGSADRTVKLWDADTGQEMLTLKGGSGAANTISTPPAVGSFTMLTLRGHLAAINSVVFSPDGKRLATGSDDRTVKLWDAATGREIFTLRGHADAINSVAFSPDGKRLRDRE